MPAKVYHLRNLSENFPDGFELVAEINTENLDMVFQLTNHIDQPWWENSGVKTIVRSRSTSVGDVVVIGEKKYRCEPIGWREV